MHGINGAQRTAEENGVDRSYPNRLLLLGRDVPPRYRPDASRRVESSAEAPREE